VIAYLHDATGRQYKSAKRLALAGFLAIKTAAAGLSTVNAT
jgi:hypothetical protein